jgi:hypothetical protein
MKINKYAILSLVGLLCVAACVDEDKKPFDDFSRTAIPVFATKTDDSGFINFADLAASNLSFTIDKQGVADVSNIDVTLTYNNSETGESETVVYTTVNSFPTDLTISKDELIAAFAPTVLTEDSISLGDSFVVGGYVRLADGTYLTGGYSPSIFVNNPVTITYNVACQSDLAGTYDFTLISGDNGEASSLPGQTITQVAPGYYEISDMTMDIFGPDFPIAFRFTDICGNLTPDFGSLDFGTQVTVRFNAATSIDPDTGEITFDITYIAPSCCGLAGINTVFKATPQ